MRPPRCPFDRASPLAGLTKQTRRTQPRRIAREDWSDRVLAKGTISRKLNLVLGCARQEGFFSQSVSSSSTGREPKLLFPCSPLLCNAVRSSYALAFAASSAFWVAASSDLLADFLSFLVDRPSFMQTFFPVKGLVL